MRNLRRIALPSWLVLTCVSVLVSAVRVEAREPAREFIDALLDRGYADAAVMYLNKIRESGLMPPGFEVEIPYHKARAAIAAARFERDTAKRDAMYEDATKQMQAFIKNAGSSPLVTEARDTLARLFTGRANMKVEDAKKAADAAKAKLLKEARDLYTQAQEVYTQTAEAIKEDRVKIREERKRRPEDKKKLTEQDQDLFYKQTAAKLGGLRVLEKIADTYPEGSKQEKEALTKAAEEYGKYVEQYYGFTGLIFFAQYDQAGCLKRIGEYDKAISICEELFDLSDDDETARKLKMQAGARAIRCWMAKAEGLKGEKKFRTYDEAVQKTAPIIKSFKPHEEKLPEALEFRLEFAKVLKRHVEADPDDKGRKNYAEPKKHARFVIRYSEELQGEAIKLMNAMGAEVKPEEREPETFKEAFVAARTAWETFLTARKEQKPEKEIHAARDEAMKYFQLALSLVDEEVDLNQVSSIRYLIAWIYSDQGDPYRAGVVGEFVATHDPGSSYARASANLALRAFYQLYKAAPEEEKDFHIDNIMRVCKLMADRWKTGQDIDGALHQLVSFSLQRQQVDVAAKYVARMQDGTEKKLIAQREVGLALWQTFNRANTELYYLEKSEIFPTADAAEASTALMTAAGMSPVAAIAGVAGIHSGQVRLGVLDGMKELAGKARRPLEDALAPIRKGEGEADVRAVYASLYLVKCYLESASLQTGEEATKSIRKAVDLIEDPKIGVVSILENPQHPGHAVASNPAFAADIHRTAMRAYIAYLPFSDNPDDTMKKVTAAINGLKEASAGQQISVLGIYMQLARQLQRQLDDESVHPETKKALSKGFGLFLSRVIQDTSEFQILRWVAGTCYEMGTKLDDGMGQVSPEAKTYFGLSVDAYDKIVRRAGKVSSLRSGFETYVREQLGADPVAYYRHLQIRMARTLRRLREFERAIDKYADILNDQELFLAVQVEAAETLQAWAASGSGNEEKYLDAVNGVRPKRDGKNLIWGWARTQLLLNSQLKRAEEGSEKEQQYRVMMHNARYNMINCRFLYAMSISGDERTDLLKKAKNDIEVTLTLYKDFGGKKADYLRLLDRIKARLG